jgi:hypothetical protein
MLKVARAVSVAPLTSLWWVESGVLAAWAAEDRRSFNDCSSMTVEATDSAAFGACGLKLHFRQCNNCFATDLGACRVQEQR